MNNTTSRIKKLRQIYTSKRLFRHDYTKDAFNFKWSHFNYPQTHFTKERVKEVLKYSELPATWFEGKLCLDAGCGNGRFTYAMQQLGAKVTSFDYSKEAIEKCREMNPKAFVFDLMELEPNPIYDLVFSYGVIHHTRNPQSAFKKLASQVKPNGILNLMVYARINSKYYTWPRFFFRLLPLRGKLAFVRFMVKRRGGNMQGWYDALSPKYNHSFTVDEVKEWFENEGFTEITRTDINQVTLRGRKL